MARQEGAVPHVAIVARPLELDALIAAVSHPSAGAVVTFAGTVRDVNGARRVSGIEYTAYEAMATRELRAIAEAAVDRYPALALAVEHRVGYLAVGEVSVAIVASHPHRAEAFDAVRFVIEEIKRRVPIWKREHYADGSRVWVHAGEGHGAVREVIA